MILPNNDRVSLPDFIAQLESFITLTTLVSRTIIVYRNGYKIEVIFTPLISESTKQ